MCLRDCKDCRQQARERKAGLINLLLIVAFLTGLCSLWAVEAWSGSWLPFLGIASAFGLLWMAVEVERS